MDIMKIDKRIVTAAAYTLTMSLDEVRLLRDLLARVGGDKDTTRCGLAQALIEDFNQAGIFRRLYSGAPDLIGALTFKPVPDDEV